MLVGDSSYSASSFVLCYGCSALSLAFVYFGGRLVSSFLEVMPVLGCFFEFYLTIYEKGYLLLLFLLRLS